MISTQTNHHGIDSIKMIDDDANFDCRQTWIDMIQFEHRTESYAYRCDQLQMNIFWWVRKKSTNASNGECAGKYWFYNASSVRIFLHSFSMRSQAVCHRSQPNCTLFCFRVKHTHRWMRSIGQRQAFHLRFFPLNILTDIPHKDLLLRIFASNFMICFEFGP